MNVISLSQAKARLEQKKLDEANKTHFVPPPPTHVPEGLFSGNQTFPGNSTNNSQLSPGMFSDFETFSEEDRKVLESLDKDSLESMAEKTRKAKEKQDEERRKHNEAVKRQYNLKSK